MVTQPGQLRAMLAQAGPKGAIHVVYQPKAGDLVEHWEHFGWMCLKAQNLIVMADEVDGICSAGSSKNAASPYWKTAGGRVPALEQIVQYGRHHHVAFIGIARAPQDVWRRLTGQAGRMLVFRMNERLELDAVRSRLGSATDDLPNLGQWEYLDWEENGPIEVAGGSDS